MGHDITAYKNAKVEDSYMIGEDEIAYIRFGAGNPDAFPFYEMLNCLPFFAGVSGDGTTVQIKKSLFESIKQPEFERENCLERSEEFIDKIKKYLEETGAEQVFIEFT